VTCRGSNVHKQEGGRGSACAERKGGEVRDLPGKIMGLAVAGGVGGGAEESSMRDPRSPKGPPLITKKRRGRGARCVEGVISKNTGKPSTKGRGEYSVDPAGGG